MSFPNTLVSWVVWFYDTFISPLIQLCKNTDVLGYSLFNWLLGFAVLSIAVNFLCDLFNSDRKE